MGSAASLLERRYRISPSRNLITLKGHDGSVNAMTISPDGTFLATASEDTTCRVWNCRSWELQAELRGHTQYVGCVAANNECVITGSADKTLRKWSPLSGNTLLVFTGHSSGVNCVELQDNLVYSASFDKTARQWKVDTGECLRVYRGHTRPVTPLLLVNLPFPDRRIQRRKSITKMLLERTLSSTCNCSIVPSWQYKTLLITGERAGKRYFFALYFIRRGRLRATYVFAGSVDRTARAWAPDHLTSVTTYHGHSSAVTCLAANPRLHELYTGSSDGSARSWDMETGQLLQRFVGHHGSVTCLQVCAKKGSYYNRCTVSFQQFC